MALSPWIECTDRHGKPLPPSKRAKCNQYRALYGFDPLPEQTIPPTEPNSRAHAEKFTNSSGNTSPNPHNPTSSGESVKPPGWVKKAVNYSAAIAKWIKAGVPTRSEERILEILHTHCEPCEHYGNGACSVCGCECNDSKAGLRNKLAMATEKCPKGKWE